MKKLMIALAVTVCAVAANAAAFNWTSSGTNSGKTINGKNGSALYSATTAYTLYLFDAGVTSQDVLLAGLRGDKAITDFTSVASQTLASNSRITAQEFSYGETGTTYNYYMAVINGDDVFLSASVSSMAQLADTSNVSFSGLGNATKNAFADTTATFAASGAGWYSTAAVPEPTSGLLMLLGMAGLALRRRRA